MGSTRWDAARRAITAPFGSVFFKTTTNIAADNYVISDELADEFIDDEEFKGRYLILPGANAARKNLRVTDYQSSTGRLTVAGGVLAAENAAVAGELHRFRPSEMVDYFNRAADYLYPNLCVIREYVTIVERDLASRFTLPSTMRGRPSLVFISSRVRSANVKGQLLDNPSFEEWTGAAPDHWTLTDLTGRRIHTNDEVNEGILGGDSSLQAQSVGGTLGRLSQDVSVGNNGAGLTAHFSVWVYCETAGAVKARCVDVDGDAHQGAGWELLRASKLLDATHSDVQVEVRAENPAATSFFVDEASLVLGSQAILRVDEWTLKNWDWLAPVDGSDDGGQLIINSGVAPPGAELRVVGGGPLSRVAEDSDVVEVDGDLAEPLYLKTQQYIAQGQTWSGRPEEREQWIRAAGTLGRQTDRLINRGVFVRRPSLVSRGF